jgi:hypothetical protein
MSIQKINPSSTILLIMIAAVGAVRVLFNFNHDISVLANFSPLGAMAIFGGASFNRRWKAFCFPLLTLFISDFILHQTVFKSSGNGFLYGGWYWVYAAFALMTFAGRWIMNKPSVLNFLAATITCVMIHWLLTDLGVWMGSKVYSQDLKGYIDCLVAAIPYELKFLAGTVVYGGILFGSFEWMKERYGRLVLTRN